MKRLTVHSGFSIICFLFVSMGYSPMAGGQKVDPAIFKGRTVIEDVYSPGLENNFLESPANQPVKVYLPPGYDDCPFNEYPVVYLLHPYWSDYNSYYISYPGLFDLLNQLISERAIVPMIVVTPNASNKYLGSYYTNSYATGNWEDYIVQDVIREIEGKYSVLDQKQSRGLAGIEMGGYGTAIIGMRHPDIFNSIGIGNAILDFREWFIDGTSKKYAIKAASINKFRPGDSREIHTCFAQAAAFAPDSTARPVFGRLPYTEDGVLIDSIWQKWLAHDPVTMLQTYRDGVQKLNAIQLFGSERDDPRSQSFECFHKALLDHGIKHGYEVYTVNVLDHLFGFFSENLAGIVPTVCLSGAYYHDNTDSLVVSSDFNGRIYVVPSSTNRAIDSIFKYQVATADVFANTPVEIKLSEFGYAKYRVFAVNSDNAISNIPGEFCVVPDKSPPLLSLGTDTVALGDSIRVSISRDGTICLISPGLFMLDNLRTASDIMYSSRLIECTEALADAEVSFSTDGPTAKSYWIYGFDKYGIVSDPITVLVRDLTSALIEMVDRPLEIELFPNPAVEKITIQSNIIGIYEVSITSLNGQLFYKIRMEGSTQQISLSSLQKGIYIVSVRSMSSVTKKKMIKL
jgi:S-formylglutathione hydrolase